MQFDQLIFLFAFLPVSVILYAVCPQKLKNALLLIVSVAFAAWGRPVDALIVVLSGFFNYFTGLLIGELRKKGLRRCAGAAFGFGLAADIALLVFYKYLPAASPAFSALRAPVGVSFFTFGAISYLADVFTKKIEPAKNPVGFLLFTAFFAKLVSGPITSYRELESQITRRKSDFALTEKGFKRFTVGLSKKLLIANSLTPVFSALSQKGSMSAAEAWLGALCYAFILFFDFSGYSDMAIGIGNMFGFELPENFDLPYAKQSMTQFWRSWHASLGRWFRDCVYIPLGGSRVGKARLIFNLFAVWILTGLWHGANLTFLVWGLYHFLFLVLEKTLFKNALDKIPRPVRTAAVFLIALIGWVPFFSPNLTSALGYLKNMFVNPALFDSTALYYLKSCALPLAVSVFISFGAAKKLSQKIKERFETLSGVLEPIGLTVLLALCAAVMTSQTYSSFLYAAF